MSMAFVRVMHFCLMLSLASGIIAQTPTGFSPSAQAHLNVSFGNITITPPGLLVPRASTASAPQIAPTSAANGTYIIFMMDLDVSMNGTATDLLHWFAPDRTFASYPGNLTLVNTTASRPGADYLQPSPPPGTGLHRYVEILFAQPPGFTVPSQFASINPPATTLARIGFNLTDFVAAAGLGQPIAGNYFRVQASSATTTSSGTPTASATASASSSVVPFQGSASIQGIVSWRRLWVAFTMGLVGAWMWMI